MMAVHAVPKLPKSGRTLMEDRHQRKLDTAKALQECYANVDERDKRHCRVTGKPLTAGASDPRKRLERHHMQARSLAPSERHNPANVLTVSGWVHNQIGAAKLHVSGDANLRDGNGKFCGVVLEQNTETGWQVIGCV